MSRARDVKSRDRSLGSLEMLPRWNFRCFPSAFSLRFSLSVDRRSTSSDKFRGALSPLRKVKSEITLIPSRAIAAKRQLSAVSKPDGISPKFPPSRFSASIFNFASFASRFCARACPYLQSQPFIKFSRIEISKSFRPSDRNRWSHRK